MGSELTGMAWVVLIVGTTAAHLGVILGARKINPLFLIAGGFLLLAPVSGAHELPSVILNGAKYARVYCTVLIVITGFVTVGIPRLGLASVALLAFSSLYWIAGIWSANPFSAIVYKSFFAFAIFAGIYMAYSVRDRKELTAGLRYLSVVASFGAVVAFALFIQNPQAMLDMGRWRFHGMNANHLGLTAAPMALFCGYLAFYDTSKAWKIYGYIGGAILALAVAFTGSRSAAAMLAVGTFMLLLPMSKHPIRMTIVFGLISLFIFLVVTYVEIDAVTRLVDMPESAGDVASSRSGYWKLALDYWKEAPIHGKGWVYPTRRIGFFNLHNVYLQVLAETGAIGIISFGISILLITLRAFHSFFLARRDRESAGFLALALALVFSILVHGIGESSFLAGSVLGSLLFPLAAGLIDRAPELAKGEKPKFVYYRFLRTKAEPGNGAGPTASKKPEG